MYITWPTFIYFVKNEEKEFRINNFNSDNDFEKKNINITKSLNSIKLNTNNKNYESFKRKYF